MSTRDLLQRTAEIAADYLDSLEERPVRPEAGIDELRAALGGPLPEQPRGDLEVIEKLARDADPGLMASPGGRFFGFVIGGTVPAAIAADWLTSAWDQNAAQTLPMPAAGARRGGRRRLAEGAARPARDRLVRIRHRRSDGALHLPCSSASRHARPGGVGCRA